MRRFGIVGMWVAAGFAFACGGSDATEPNGQPGIRFVAGDGLTDTASSTPSQRLIVEVRNAAGALAKGVEVKFVCLPKLLPLPGTAMLVSTNPPGFALFASTLTDSSGRTAVNVHMETNAQTGLIAVSVPELGFLDTASFTILPGAATHVLIAPIDTIAYLGGALTLRAVAADQWVNLRLNDAVSWSVSSSKASITSSGNFSATAIGRYTATVTSGRSTGTTTVTVVPPAHIVGLVPLQQGQLTAIDLNGANKRVLATAVNGNSGPHPSWMPDGNSVVYSTIVNNVEVLRIVDMSGAVRPVFPNGVPNVTNMVDPSPTADGKWLYFSATDTRCAPTYCLYRSKIDGSAPELMGNVETAGLTRPSPSPDGSHVAMQVGGAIRVLDVTTQILSAWSVPGGINPSWSPDGSRIAYFANNAINAIKPDGTGATVLAANSGGHTYTGYVAWSSDGKYLAASTLFAPLDLIDVQTGVVFPLPSAFVFGAMAMR